MFRLLPLAALLMGCATAPRPSRPQLNVPGLPTDLWAGFAPGSWVRFQYSRQGFQQESVFRLHEDGSIGEEPQGGKGSRMGHGVGAVDLPGLNAPQWTETDKREMIEVDGRRFDCNVREGRIIVPICGNALQLGLKNPVHKVKVLWSTEASTPGGVLRWDSSIEGSKSTFEYQKIGPESIVEYEIGWKEGDGHKDRLVLSEAVPGRVVEMTSHWNQNGRPMDHVWKMLDYHAVRPQE